MAKKRKITNIGLHHGETSATRNIESLGLSPKPITTGREPMSITTFLTKTKDGLLEFQLFNSETFPLQLLFLQFILTFIGSSYLLSLSFTAWGLIPLMLLGFIMLNSVSYYFFKDIKQDVASNVPIRFHSQKKAILFSSFIKGKKIKRPDFMKSAYTGIMFGVGALFSTLGLAELGIELQDKIQEDTPIDQDMVIFALACLVLGAYPTYYTLKPWFLYFKQGFQDKEKQKGKIRLYSVPWEEVNIEYQSMEGMNYIGHMSMQNLTFTALVPNQSDPDKNEKMFFSLPVYSKEEALSLYELLRDYMEKGAEGIEHTAANDIEALQGDHSRAGYRRLINKRFDDMQWWYPIWRLFNILTLRYYVHWYLEYLYKGISKNIASLDEFKQWSKPIPKEEWVKQSDELTVMVKFFCRDFKPHFLTHYIFGAESYNQEPNVCVDNCKTSHTG